MALPQVVFFLTAVAVAVLGAVFAGVAPVWLVRLRGRGAGREDVLTIDVSDEGVIELCP